MNEASSGPPPDTAGTADDGEPDASERATGRDPGPHPKADPKADPEADPKAEPEAEPEPSPGGPSHDAAPRGRTRIGPNGTYEPL